MSGNVTLREFLARTRFELGEGKAALAFDIRALPERLQSCGQPSAQKNANFVAFPRTRDWLNGGPENPPLHYPDEHLRELEGDLAGLRLRDLLKNFTPKP